MIIVLISSLMVIITSASSRIRTNKKCDFPAVYNFGDSNSDTGAISAAIGEVPPPNGVAFFGRSAGRHSDGRLIIDFISENLTLPYLTPYLDSVGAYYRYGANFATGGACIRPSGGCFSPFHLGTQVVQFLHFKTRTISLYSRTNGKTPLCKNVLARPNDFSKALYTFDIGQNDITIGFTNSTEEQLKASIPEIIGNFTNAIQILYKEGARYFWIHNTGPAGCLPYVLKSFPDTPRDRYGCVKPLNNGAIEFNRQLKNRISELKKQLTYAVFTYVDVYSAKYTLISKAKSLGFADPFDYCCVGAIGRGMGCGKTILQNGTELFSISCKNPASYISWDGIHLTETANMWVANRILNGSLSDLPNPTREACRYPRL
ncbi:PREDICTED: GDSL esterase/lipase At3g27950 [Tarenaya hassleriana]|uniref:GDSL esterase/lipase At3g27950 n=1 Tax=Tarenaya hassleriana TaxID=28532 RepID=UPI00053C51B6|nr:PREDICTED: GDSL esterase/lipase At3g27950 [Tarenaya hassleriana]